MAKVKPKTKTKKQSKKVKRAKNGQIVAGSARLPNSGRPRGAKSTGKNKSVGSKKNSVVKSNKKSAGAVKKRNKFAAKKHTSSTGVIRNSKGQLVKGTKSISKGRPTGNSSIDELNSAIRQAEREKGKNAKWLVDLIKRSWSDSSLAIAILSRKFPALKAIQLTQSQHTDDDKAKVAEIRKKYKERFKPVPQEIKELRAENARLKHQAEQQTRGIDNAERC